MAHAALAITSATVATRRAASALGAVGDAPLLLEIVELAKRAIVRRKPRLALSNSPPFPNPARRFHGFATGGRRDLALVQAEYLRLDHAVDVDELFHDRAHRLVSRLVEQGVELLVDRRSPRDAVVGGELFVLLRGRLGGGRLLETFPRRREGLGPWRFP